MQLMKKFRFLVVSVMAVVAVVSCTSIDCSVNSVVSCVYGFRSPADEKVTLINPITVVAHRPMDGSDSVLVNRLANAKELMLPMSYALDADTLDFIIERVTQQGDTIISKDQVIVTKTNEPVFESVDCTPRYNHTITNVQSTHNVIDTLVVKKAFVTTDVQENILIYIHN